MLLSLVTGNLNSLQRRPAGTLSPSDSHGTVQVTPVRQILLGTQAQAPSSDSGFHQQIGLRLFQIIFISIDYTRLFTIMHDYLRLFHCENPNDYSTSLHYLQKDDNSTYCTTFIPLIFFGTYYCDYCDYSTIMCIIFIANYYIYYLI